MVTSPRWSMRRAIVPTSFSSILPATCRTAADGYAVTAAELAAADAYEVSAYKRIEAVLKSGKSAWVYVKA